MSVPHFMAQGAVSAVPTATDNAKPQDIESGYGCGSVETCNKLAGNLQFRNGPVEWVAVAMRRRDTAPKRLTAA
jgi:hypothetical protein